MVPTDRRPDSRIFSVCSSSPTLVSTPTDENSQKKEDGEIATEKKGPAAAQAAKASNQPSFGSRLQGRLFKVLCLDKRMAPAGKAAGDSDISWPWNFQVRSSSADIVPLCAHADAQRRSTMSTLTRRACFPAPNHFYGH